MPALAVLAILLFTSADALAYCRGCGCRGGPGYRGPSGRCVGWADIGRVCGSPPTTRCSAEGAATQSAAPRRPKAKAAPE